MTMPGGRPYWWTPHIQDPLFDELKRQELRLLDAARELDDRPDPQQYRPHFEAVLTGVVLLVVLPGLLILMSWITG